MAIVLLVDAGMMYGMVWRIVELWSGEESTVTGELEDG
jgi:hypothetical protein